MNCRFLTALCALLLLIPGRAHAANRESAVSPALVGTVRDTTGVPLPLVQVIVAEVGRTTTTDAEGRFVLRGLPSGTYHVTTLLIGYRPGHAVVRVPESGPDVAVSIVMIGSTLRLQTVSVTAASSSGEASGVTQATSELSGKHLQRSLGASLAQTLSAEPGMAMRYNGPAATMPVIRGLSGDRILVLQDGARSGDLASSAPDHSTSVDPLSAQRIEVVRGPASLMHGNSALGGVVNVISNDIPTDVPSRVTGSVTTQVESVNPGGAFNAGAVHPVSDKIVLNFRAGARHTDAVRVGGGGTLDGTSNRSANVTAGLGFVNDDAQGGLAFKAFDFNYGLPAEPGSDESGIRIDGRRYQATAKLASNTGRHAVSQLRFEGSAQDYAHQEIEPDGAIGTSFTLRTQTASLTAPTHFGRMTGLLGAQALLRQYAAEGEEALTPAANAGSFGAFIFQELGLGAGHADNAGHSDEGARVQFGARFDTYRISSKAGDEKFGAARTLVFRSVSGSVGVSAPLAEHVTLSGSVARAFRAPTVEELFSHAVHAATGSYELGNADLDVERSVGFDAVLRVGGASLSGQVSGYLNRVEGYIAPDVTSDTTVEGETMPLARYGQRDATLRGIEAQGEAKLGPRFVLGVVGDVTRGQFTDGGPLPFMPAGRLGASLRWDSGRFNAGGEARHVFAQRDATGGQDVETGAYTLLNVSAGWSLTMGGRIHQLTLRGDNLGDVKFYDATSRIKSYAANPGRNLSLVYRVMF
ncbi:MAG: TonB-dependent receptor [Gemmatimonadota bacterium]|nr:TonB-dependent receptor [Gemmatimonadota bacterium]